MIKRYLKKLSKNNKWSNLLCYIIYFYLRLVYATSRLTFIGPEGKSETHVPKFDKTIFILWHNRIALITAIFPRVFLDIENLSILASPHSDGKMISNIFSKSLDISVIEGSSNKNPVGVLKKIITTLNNKHNLIITPDGPRGPVYQINSNLIGITQKCNNKIVPLTVSCSRYFTLNSWDKLFIPLPFGNILVLRGEEITEFIGDNNALTANLQSALNKITNTADMMIQR
ncbi:MAG: DUF374 domain-containing protein [Rickettsiaceae bacterium]|nr:MAG: DUF374 domain-containing protein [Rickettsiaceae bacterium]